MPPPRIVEPTYPLWALPAATLALGAWISVLPGSPLVARAAAAAASGDARGALLAAAAGDLAFGASVLAFVRLSELYGRERHPGGGVRPYLGPWRRDASSSSSSLSHSRPTTRTRTRTTTRTKNTDNAAAAADDASAAAAASAAVVPPRLFAPFYLLLALSCACLAPAAGLAHSLLTTGGLSDSTAAGASAAVALGPYLALFAWQWLLEMKLCRRSLLAPAVPLAFSLARPWQLARSAALVEYLAEAAAAVPLASALAGEKAPLLLPSPPWLPAALRLLSLFWTFDTAALLVWLPWTYNWQTQA